MLIEVDMQHVSRFLGKQELAAMAPQVQSAHEQLHTGAGLGSEFTGWLDLPIRYDREEFARIQAAAARIQADSDILIVIGIGGSYLGARAAVEFLHSDAYNALPKSTPDIYFAGNTLSPSALAELVLLCKGKRVSLNMISKSGTTTEPAVAFRVLKEMLEEQCGKEEARRRIICTTDRCKGTLKQLADREGYETFVVPDDVGGRYSVLTAVGLLPIAVSGADISALMEGAVWARETYRHADVQANACYQYAAVRNLLYRKGKEIELLVSYEPRFAMMSEWWKQLYGESEGKDQKGIFPASAVFSTDLHSMGQYIQDGRRHLFETIVLVEKPAREITLAEEQEDIDGLNFLAGKTLSYVNHRAFEGTALAHEDGGVPSLVIRVEDFSERSLGALIYFFEKACAVSGYLLGVNPFDQPGVESYKKNMFALLGKPGYETQRQALQARLQKNCVPAKPADG